MIVPGEMSWLQMLFTNRGGVLTRTLPRVLFITAFALVVTAITDLTVYDFPKLSLQPFQIVGVALGIFLAFRNNAAYDRFWEGRKLWGSLVNTSRSFSRQILAFVVPPNPDEAESRELLAVQRRFLMQEIAFVNSLRRHLRRESPFDDLARMLPAAEVDELRAVQNVPVEILRQIGVDVRDVWRRGWINDYHVPIFEQSLIELTNIQGACERILNTPFPFPYSVLLHRIVAVYCLFLCFGLVHESGWATPFVVFLISHAFFGFDEIGDELEQPFGHDPCDLPLNQLCGVIEANLRQMLGENNFPLPTVPPSGIVS